MHRVIGYLPGLELKERRFLEDLFKSDIDESGSMQGIDRQELERIIADLHKDRSMYPSLTDDEIERVKAALEKML